MAHFDIKTYILMKYFITKGKCNEFDALFNIDIIDGPLNFIRTLLTDKMSVFSPRMEFLVYYIDMT